MKTYNSHTQAVVMRRVHYIHVFKSFLTSTALAAAILLLSLWGIDREVWVAHVIHNMPSPVHIIAFTRFIEAAFFNTRFIVQVLSILTVGAAVWLVYGLIRLLHRETTIISSRPI